MTRPGSSGYDPFEAPDGSHDHVGAGYAGGYTAPPVTGYEPSKGTGLAVSALVLGLLAIPFGFIVVGGVFGIIAIILAIFALRRAASARRLGAQGTGGTTAMSVIGILSAVAGIVIAGFILWAAIFTMGSIAPCEHLIDDPEAFQTCVNEHLDDRLGGN